MGGGTLSDCALCGRGIWSAEAPRTWACSCGGAHYVCWVCLGRHGLGLREGVPACPLDPALRVALEVMGQLAPEGSTWNSAPRRARTRHLA